MISRRSWMTLAATAVPGCLHQPLPAAGRWIRFAGLWFAVRQDPGPAGPGRNRWSSSHRSVWVDSRGLHLALRRDGRGTVACAEVVSAHPVTPGRVTVTVEREGDWGAHVVAGMFVYENDHSEVDVELTRWGVLGGPGVHHTVAGVRSDALALELGHRSTHRIVAADGCVRVETETGAQTVSSTFEGPLVPRPGSHRLHINLWALAQGLADVEPCVLRVTDLRVEPF